MRPVCDALRSALFLSTTWESLNGMLVAVFLGTYEVGTLNISHQAFTKNTVANFGVGSGRRTPHS